MFGFLKLYELLTECFFPYWDVENKWLRSSSQNFFKHRKVGKLFVFGNYLSIKFWNSMHAFNVPEWKRTWGLINCSGSSILVWFPAVRDVPSFIIKKFIDYINKNWVEKSTYKCYIIRKKKLNICYKNLIYFLIRILN
jgi:hypothetical protein